MNAMIKQNRNEVSSAQTIAHLIRIGRRHFAEFGYAKTSLESIVEEAECTRGALYHHFKNKKDLFLHVLAQVQKEIGEYVEQKADSVQDIWQQLLFGCIAFVECATKVENKRIVLIDAPSMLDWQEWKKNDSAYAENSLLYQLTLCMEQKLLLPLDIHCLASMISGALNELALYIANTNNIDEINLHDCISNLLKGFRKQQ